MKRSLLAPAAWLYGAAASVRNRAYDRGWLAAEQLDCPVISVGNMTAGGTGKTPLVELIARALLAQGKKPAILTRGYGRGPGPSIVHIDPAPDRSPDPRMAGDEPALLAAALPEVPIVISGSRVQAGRAAVERHHPDVLLLDDGFQHRRLARQLDIVAIDLSRPLSDGAMIPRGRQRERCAGIARAHAVVLTRSELAGAAEPVEQFVRDRNPRVRIFHGKTRLAGWQRLIDGIRQPADFAAGRRAFAFCAIGNPDAFFRDLARWGLALAGSRSFRDHHVYANSEIARLVIEANRSKSTLVTTAKDVQNLPSDWRRTLPALAALIEAEIEEMKEFEKMLVEVI